MISKALHHVVSSVGWVRVFRQVWVWVLNSDLVDVDGARLAMELNPSGLN
jgi:hypothetical protein